MKTETFVGNHYASETMKKIVREICPELTYWSDSPAKYIDQNTAIKTTPKKSPACFKFLDRSEYEYRHFPIRFHGKVTCNDHESQYFRLTCYISEHATKEFAIQVGKKLEMRLREDSPRLRLELRLEPYGSTHTECLAFRRKHGGDWERYHEYCGMDY